LADIFGFWRYPVNRDPDQYSKKLLTRMNWWYKNWKPIVKAEKDSELEAYFTETRRKIHQLLFPQGFQHETSARISAVGDLMCAKNLENSVGKFYAKVADLIFDADISIANLESALTRAKNTYSGWKIQSTREQFDAFKGHKNKQYTVFCTANNHILDRGMEGFNNTHELLQAEGFYYVGTNQSPEAHKKGLILNSEGIKFGFVAATWSLNEQFSQKRMEGYLVNVVPFHRFKGKVDVSILEEQISYCRSLNCDFIILSLHWGMEFEFYPRQEQVDIAHYLIECGADAIISHHTHNIQPYEFYQTLRDPHRKAPIFYGLGNLSSLSFTPHRALSLIANFEVVKGHVNGDQKTLVARAHVTPVLQVEYDSNETPYLQIEKLSDLIKSACSEGRREYVNKSCYYADLVIGKSWRN
jgi:poly-gamma-glutamate synthesis protein (capsule biosynthesis protein)